MPSASSPPRKRARKAIIQLRLSTQAAERLESLLRENRGNEIKAVVDESGVLAALHLGSEAFPLDSNKEENPGMAVLLSRPRPVRRLGVAGKLPPSSQGGREGGVEEVGYVYEKASVVVTAVEQQQQQQQQQHQLQQLEGGGEEGGGREGGREGKRTLKTVGVALPASHQEQLERKQRRNGGLLPDPVTLRDDGKGKGKKGAAAAAAAGGGGSGRALQALGLKGGRDVGKREFWLQAHIASCDVSGKELREGLFRGINLHAQDPIRWLPSAEALAGKGCTLLVRFASPQITELAYQRNNEHIVLPGGQGLALDEVQGFGLVLTGHRSLKQTLSCLENALSSTVKNKLWNVYSRLLPSLRKGVPPPGSQASPETFFQQIEKAYLKPLEQAALYLAATKKHPSKFIAPELRPAPSEADVALAALTTARRGLQRWLSKIRSNTVVQSCRVPAILSHMPVRRDGNVNKTRKDNDEEQEGNKGEGNSGKGVTGGDGGEGSGSDGSLEIDLG